MSTILLDYEARLTALHAAASQLRFGQTLAFAMMSTLLIATAVLLFFALAKHTVRVSVAMLPAPVAFYAGLIGKQRNRALLRTLRLQTYYERGVDRLEGRWVSSENTGEEFSCSGHCYGRDLQVIGEASLYQLLCTCRTEAGRKRLAEYLLQTPRREELLDRQTAVRELQSEVELRERIGLIGDYSFQQSSWETVTEWLGSPLVTASSTFRITALLSSISLAVLVLLGMGSVVAWMHLAAWITGILVILTVLGLHYRAELLKALPAIRSLNLEIGILREGLDLLRVQRFQSPLLKNLIEATLPANPCTHLRRLERLTRTITECDKEWFYLPSRALLVGIQTFLALEQWRVLHGKSLRRWLEVWAEFDALMALANYAYEHPDNTFPVFAAGGTTFESEDLGHPLMLPETCIVNDVVLNEQTRFYVISGSNMSGKSTLLRTMGLNAVLAYAGAPVSAKKMRISRFSICASLTIADSLFSGKSKFLAEIERLKQALRVPVSEGPVLFLLDEILAGTNSRDRRKAAETIVKALLQQGASGALSTHDLALTELADLAGCPGRNMHMASNDDNDPLHFDYKLKPGVTTQSSALAIAKLAGIADQV